MCEWQLWLSSCFSAGGEEINLPSLKLVTDKISTFIFLIRKSKKKTNLQLVLYKGLILNGEFTQLIYAATIILISNILKIRL